METRPITARSLLRDRLWLVAFAILWAADWGWAASTVEMPSGYVERLNGVADRLLDEAKVSYVYGGYQIGDGDACLKCNQCLEVAKPEAKERLRLCPVCSSCSLDCSHFTHLVFQEAGLPYPYIDTKTMLKLSADALLRRYRLVDKGADPLRARPGDLLVFDGHVVLVQRLAFGAAQEEERGRGDVIHATGGRDVKGPGEGIQRERFVTFARFRGPLRKILRHVELDFPGDKGARVERQEKRAPASTPGKTMDPASRRKLRPVAKRLPKDD
ncbi:hypothetical protein E3A20_03870 [Planctomyces bekefii]|uniref:Uncharacterized protein n=1 Tax=Planctomyces bekefii TaxID=1653850 RepID=A0A5C6MCM7_9PLAN|nr:hypothetical protein E3A20_03870 [Planctomyces bekefii]